MDLRDILPVEQIHEDEPMYKHTTFRVGGKAALFLDIKTSEELQHILKLFSEEKRPYFVIGNGSNLLVSDKGYDGVILHLGAGFDQITVDGNRITAQAGAMLSKVAYTAMEHGLKGLEFASGIPGSVGGGVMMNAGAYGGEMSQVVTYIKGLDAKGNPVYLDNEQAQFTYRSSILKKNHMIATEIGFELEPGDKEEIQKVVSELSEKRREKQPLEFPSAGSTFKRPEGYYAGKLIMDAGLRGYRVGDAQVSEKHCGFVINRGNATASEIHQLMLDVQKKVAEKFQVNLEPEVIRLGDF